MGETQDRPKWLLELENRKRKPRLAHEAGAGAPCMVCSSACPGLDLHFWRKICKNCKCSRDDHDVEDDDFPQFDLLFGSSRKYKKKPMLLHVNNEKQHEGEAAFEWVPPDTTKELAADYMKALPAEKLPIKGSAGAALRRQLLQKQLPLHDIDHKACDELSEQEKKQFEKYLENIKKYVGQGKVTKILSARPFDRSLMTPANATDMQRFSPQHKPSVPTNIPQLRTPSSFTGKSPYGKNYYENHNKQDAFGSDAISNQNVRQNLAEKYNLISKPNDSETARSELVKSGIYNKGSYLNNLLPSDQSQNHGRHPESSSTFEGTAPLDQSEYCRQGYMDTLRNPAMSLVHSQTLNDNAQLAESILADALLPPSMIHANDIIGSTLDEKGLMFIREKLTNKYSSQENQMVHNAQNVSRDLNATDLLRKGSTTPRNNNLPQSLDKESERSAIIAAMKSPSGTSTLLEDRIKRIDNVEYKPVKAEMEMIKPASQIVESVSLNSTPVRGVNEKGSPLQAKESNYNVIPGALLHPASRMAENPERLPQAPIFSNNPDDSPQSKYKSTDSLPSVSTLDPTHPTYSPFRANPNNYQAQLSSSSVPCNVIHSEGLRNQIFPHEAIGATHEENQNLPNIEQLKGAMEELTMNSTKPEKCHNCEEEIRVGDVVVITEKAKNATWHPGCFVCSMCNELLVDLVYFHYKNKLYCGRDLATLLGIPRCFACDELIFVREYTVAEGHNYHVKHFCCWDCDVPLAGQRYITENDRPLCLPCYQKTYAKTCNACDKVIAADQKGVAVKNLNFHASEGCFCCYACKKSLLNGRMAVKEEKLFCSKECIAKYLHPQP